MIEIRGNYPRRLREQLRRSFTLFWCDASACLNALRSAVEIVLDDKSIPPGKLHDRIKKFEETEPETARRLMAVKWLGNEGSHADEPTQESTLEALDVLDYVLEDMYLRRRARVDSIVERVNKDKGSGG